VSVASVHFHALIHIDADIQIHDMNIDMDTDTEMDIDMVTDMDTDADTAHRVLNISGPIHYSIGSDVRHRISDLKKV
jgi:hypothetical protein